MIKKYSAFSKNFSQHIIIIVYRAALRQPAGGKAPQGTAAAGSGARENGVANATPLRNLISYRLTAPLRRRGVFGIEKDKTPGGAGRLVQCWGGGEKTMSEEKKNEKKEDKVSDCVSAKAQRGGGGVSRASRQRKRGALATRFQDRSAARLAMQAAHTFLPL